MRWRPGSRGSDSVRGPFPSETPVADWLEGSAPLDVRELREDRVADGPVEPVGVDAHGFVQMETGFGGARVVDWLAGEQLPRIC